MALINILREIAKALLIIKLLATTPGNDYKAIKIKVVLQGDKIRLLFFPIFILSPPPKSILVYQPWLLKSQVTDT